MKKFLPPAPFMVQNIFARCELERVAASQLPSICTGRLSFLCQSATGIKPVARTKRKAAIARSQAWIIRGPSPGRNAAATVG